MTFQIKGMIQEIRGLCTETKGLTWDCVSVMKGRVCIESICTRVNKVSKGP